MRPGRRPTVRAKGVTIRHTTSTGPYHQSVASASTGSVNVVGSSRANSC